MLSGHPRRPHGDACALKCHSRFQLVIPAFNLSFPRMRESMPAPLHRLTR